MQLDRSTIGWLRNEESCQLSKIARDYCGDGKVSIEYKTFPEQPVGEKCLRRVFLYDERGNNVGTRVSVVTWTQAFEDTVFPALTGVFLSHVNVEDERPAGTVVGELCGAGGTPPYTFSITSDPSNKFDIVNGNQLVLTDKAESADVSYFVTIEVTDADSNTASDIFEILVFPVGTATGTFTFTGLSVGGRITEVALTDAAWVALPAAALADRNSIAVQNISGNGNTVLYNYSNVAPSTEGWRIEDGGFKSVAITDSIIVYARMLSGTGSIAIDEVA